MALEQQVDFPLAVSRSKGMLKWHGKDKQMVVRYSKRKLWTNNDTHSASFTFMEKQNLKGKANAPQKKAEKGKKSTEKKTNFHFGTCCSRRSIFRSLYIFSSFSEATEEGEMMVKCFGCLLTYWKYVYTEWWGVRERKKVFEVRRGNFLGKLSVSGNM